MSSPSGYMHGQIFRAPQWKVPTDSCRLSPRYMDWSCYPVFVDLPFIPIPVKPASYLNGIFSWHR